MVSKHCIFVSLWRWCNGQDDDDDGQDDDQDDADDDDDADDEADASVEDKV